VFGADFDLTPWWKPSQHFGAIFDTKEMDFFPISD
jgi:hypothetical protein